MTILKAKQERFCIEYVIDLNGTQAAIRAGYSAKTAPEQAARLLTNVKVQNRIAELKAERNQALNVDAAFVLQRLIDIDKMDVLDIMNNDLSFKPLNDWPKCWRQYLSGVDVAEINGINEKGERSLSGLLKKIKWPDKQRNIEMIARHVGFFEKDNAQKKANIDLTTINLPELTNEQLLELMIKESGK